MDKLSLKNTYRETLINTESFKTLDAFDTFFELFNDSHFFNLEPKNKGKIKRVIFNLNSIFLQKKFFLGKNTYPFSFIINKNHLTFYIRINHIEIASQEIRARFDTPVKKSKTEYRFYVRNKTDVFDLVKLLFNNILHLKIETDLNNSDRALQTFIENVDTINIETKDTIKFIISKFRTGQQKFREQLMKRWDNACSVTMLKNKNLLIASHIKSFMESSDIEKYDIDNGILLSPNLDKLFDYHLISFDKNGHIILSKSISMKDFHILGIQKDMKLKFINDGMEKYLQIHRGTFYMKNDGKKT